MDNFQWNFNKNKGIFIQENAFENAVFNMWAMFFWSWCINTCGCSWQQGNGNGEIFTDVSKVWKQPPKIELTHLHLVKILLIPDG